MPDAMTARYDYIEDKNSRSAYHLDENFMGSILGGSGLSIQDESAAGTPTNPVISREGGWLAFLHDNQNESQGFGLDFNDALSLRVDQGIYWEAKMRVVTLPAAGTSTMVFGLGSAYEAATGTDAAGNGVTRNMWFRLAGNGSLLVEFDDNTTDDDDNDSGFDITAAQDFYLRIVTTPTGTAGEVTINFLFADGADSEFQECVPGTTFTYTGGAGDLFQPYLISYKGTAAQPRFEIDYLRIWSDRA